MNGHASRTFWTGLSALALCALALPWEGTAWGQDAGSLPREPSNLEKAGWCLMVLSPGFRAFGATSMPGDEARLAFFAREQRRLRDENPAGDEAAELEFGLGALGPFLDQSLRRLDPAECREIADTGDFDTAAAAESRERIARAQQQAADAADAAERDRAERAAGRYEPKITRSPTLGESWDYGQVPDDFVPDLSDLPLDQTERNRMLEVGMEKSGARLVTRMAIYPHPRWALRYSSRKDDAHSEAQKALIDEDLARLEAEGARVLTCFYRSERSPNIGRKLFFWFERAPEGIGRATLAARAPQHPLLEIAEQALSSCPLSMAEALEGRRP